MLELAQKVLTQRRFTMQGQIAVRSAPPGGEPKEIREAWVGLILPFDRMSTGPLQNIVTEEKVDRVGGYAVLWCDAMDALDHLPPIKAWWEAMFKDSPTLIFSPECCEEVHDDGF